MSTDRVVLVTGGSLGIGQATVAAFAARGYRVVAMARDADRLAASVAQLDHPLRARVSAMPGDVRDEADVAAAVGGTMARHGRLDVLVNSAGISMRASRRLVESDVAEWRRIIDINLTGTYLMCRAALPHLEASPDAAVVNIQSTAAYAAKAGVGVYAASKFGVRALTESLIDEYRGTGIRVSSVSPGPVDTNIWSHKIEPPDAARRSTMIRAADIADIVVWLIERPASLHIPDITVTPTRFAR
jgi:NADP-dependent 3-hydroxy acid dehydrogenase YdfG